MRILFVDNQVCEKASRKLELVVGCFEENGDQAGVFASNPDRFKSFADKAISFFSTDCQAFANPDEFLEQAGKASFLGFGKKRGRADLEKNIGQGLIIAIKEFSPDLVHINGIHPSLTVVAKVLTDIGTPFVTSCSQVIDFGKSERVLAVEAKMIIANSSWVRDQLITGFPEVFRKRVEVMPWPFLPDNDFLNLANSGQKKIYVVANSESAVAEFLEAAKIIIEKAGPVQAQIALVKELDRQKLKSACPEQLELIFAEGQKNVEASVFVYLPNCDGQEEIDSFADPVYHAMAAKVPVVSFDGGGAADAILGTGAGALIQPGDLPGLANAISVYLSNDKLAEKAGEAGARRVKNAMTPKVAAARLLAIYKQALA